VYDDNPFWVAAQGRVKIFMCMAAMAR